MGEPRIQYAKTSDGVSIAFWTLGEGMPLVWLPGGPVVNIQRGWQIPQVREWFELLAARWKVVAYDRRGSGLSQRDVADFSLDALMLDLEAVVNRLALDRAAIWGSLLLGPVAVAYAARHPDRVSHLILANTYARGADLWALPRLRAFRGLREADWDTYVEAVAHMYTPDAETLAAFIRESATPEAQKAFIDATTDHDVTDLLPEVHCPTVVLYSPGARPFVVDVGLDIVTGLASSIPGASLFVSEGPEASVRAIEEFLGEGQEAAAPPELPEGMAVLLFADIAESTALTEQLGDAAFRAKARELDASLRSVIRESGGTPVDAKVLGDGVLAVFTSARQAIDCALRCEAAGEPLGLQLHLGIHAGDVIREGNNVYGGAVNIAARIAAASQPGEVLVSDTLRGLARTSAGVTFDDRGEHELKGVGEPQRLFAVRPQDE